jgi:mannose-6-phosphate isomerase-like protein (cupin superfamily)
MDVRSRAEAEPFVTADGSLIRELLRGEEQSLAEATLNPGQATERHHHAASEELYYLLEGTGDMEVDGERRRVGPGDAVLIPPGAWHQIRNDGGGDLRFLCCCAPPYSHDDTFFE